MVDLFQKTTPKSILQGLTSALHVYMHICTPAHTEKLKSQNQIIHKHTYCTLCETMILESLDMSRKQEQERKCICGFQSRQSCHSSAYCKKVGKLSAIQVCSAVPRGLVCISSSLIASSSEEELLQTAYYKAVLGLCVWCGVWGKPDMKAPAGLRGSERAPQSVRRIEFQKSSLSSSLPPSLSPLSVSVSVQPRSHVCLSLARGGMGTLRCIQSLK